MKKLIVASCFVALMIISASCADHSQIPLEQRNIKPKRTPEDRTYQQVADEFLEGYFNWRPQTAVSLGFHEYDGRPNDYGPLSLAAEHQRLRRFRDRLASIDQRKLSPDVSRECRVLLAAIDGELFSFEVSRSYWKNPMTYADASELMTYAKRDFAPKPQRLASVISLLDAMPARTAAARE